MKPVSLIMITWNNRKVTEDCLESLSQTKPQNIPLIIIDNASTEDIKGVIESFRNTLSIKQVNNRSNIGFSKAVNQGIAGAEGKTDIVLVNNDIILTDKHWLSKLQAIAYSDPSVGIVGCRLLGDEGVFLHAGVMVPRESFWAIELGGGEADIGQYQSSKEIFAVTFALVYIKREVIEAIGTLDEQYFAYFEDVDFCLRARRAGYKIIYAGSLTCLHFQGSSTQTNKVFFNKLYRESQKIFRNKWGESEFFDYRYGLVWHSIANISIGYSLSSRYIIKELNDNNIDVRYKYIYGRDTVFPLSEPHSPDPVVLTLQSKPLINYPLQVSYSQGDLFYKNFGEYKVGFTMLEADGLPSEWVEQCNKMEEVWVPSHFNKLTFSRSGVKVPIHIMPLGVDIDHFNQHIISKRLSEKFTFLSIFEWSERKGQEILMKAFKDEFADAKDVVLILKVFNPDIRNNIELELSKLGISADDDNIIILLNADIPYYQLGSLYRGADCFVLPTRGEGWGMPIMEAMACGIPVIATNWSSQCDFLNEQVAYLLNIKGLIPAKTKSPYYTNLKWAEPDYEHLRYLMRYIYEHRDEAAQKAQHAANYIMMNYSWNKVIKIMLKRIEEIYAEI